MNQFSHSFLVIIKRDIQLAYRQRASFIYPLLFFLLIAMFFPLAGTADSRILKEIGPSVIWVAALLSCFLALDQLFRQDYEDGSLEQMILSPRSLSILVFAKVCAHWLITALPIIILSPLVAQMYYLSPFATWILCVSLLIGTPILSLIGAVISAITVSLNQSGMLLALLVMPLIIPVLIFAAGAVGAANDGISVLAPLAILSAILILLLPLAPVAISAALRIGI